MELAVASGSDPPGCLIIAAVLTGWILLTFLRDEVPANWHEWCDQVTDNFRVIDPKEFQIIG